MTPPRCPRSTTLNATSIVRALERFNNDKEAAARAIGTSRRTMFRRFKAYALYRALPSPFLLTHAIPDSPESCHEHEYAHAGKGLRH